MLLNPAASVSAASETGEGQSVASERLPASGSTGLELAGTRAYTLYFPLVFVPPPPSPKKGLGVIASPACQDLENLRAAWYFNWGVFPDPSCELPDEKFVPRIYNADSMKWLSQAVANAQPSGWLIGFSEPNLPWQGDLSPAEGAVLWRQIEQATGPAGIKLVSPSPNQWEPGQNGLPYGHQWTWAMVDAYRARYGHNPRFDAMGWNIYKGSAGEIQTYLTARHNEALDRGYDVPIWILEYGGRCVFGAISEIEATMQATTPWLNNTPWIGRYAWYANRIATPDSAGVDYTKCSLVDPGSNRLTLLGYIYWGY